jgi:hypothetical protein
MPFGASLKKIVWLSAQSLRISGRASAENSKVLGNQAEKSIHDGFDAGNCRCDDRDNGNYQAENRKVFSSRRLTMNKCHGSTPKFVFHGRQISPLPNDARI